MKEKVLVVDDEKNIADTLVYALNREGYLVDAAYDGREALEKVKTFKPKVIILDLMIPEVSGYDVCKQIDEDNIGVIMLTAKTDIVDKILGLEFGADDYLTKPFDIREVVARVKSLIRRLNKSLGEKEKDEIINIKDFSLNKSKRLITIKNRKIDFTAMEFDLIYQLLNKIDIPYSRQQLLDIVWGIDYVGVTRTVDTHVQRIRKKLGEEYQGLIQTVHGVGYKGVNIFENRN